MNEEERTQRNKIFQFESLTQTLETIVTKFGDIIKELLRAAANNPLLGVVVVLIISDILEKAKLIFPSTALMIKGIVVTATGIEFAGDILKAITDFIPLGGLGGTPNEGLLTPRATTIVYADSAEKLDKAITAILASKK